MSYWATTFLTTQSPAYSMHVTVTGLARLRSRTAEVDFE